MKKVFAETFPGGQVEAKISNVVLVNNVAKTIGVSVPNDEVWVLQNIRILNPDDVNREVNVRIFKEVAKTNQILFVGSLTITATTGQWNLPNNNPSANAALYHNIKGLVLGPTMTIEVIWAAGGASAGGTDADGLVILVRKLPLT